MSGRPEGFAAIALNACHTSATELSKIPTGSQRGVLHARMPLAIKLEKFSRKFKGYGLPAT
jgi:hypothetical protein